MSDELLLRSVPPNSPDAERCLLGSMLASRDACDLVTSIVKREDFYLEGNAVVFEALLRLRNAGAEMNVMRLKLALERDGFLGAVGGLVALAEIGDAVASDLGADFYAREVRTLSQRRAAIIYGHELMAQARDLTRPFEASLEKHEQRIFALRSLAGSAANQPKSVTELLPAVFESIQKARQGGLQGIPSGIRDLDEITTGFHAGELVLVAARPSVGKTSAALAVIRHAVESEIPCAFFSVEMGDFQATLNLVCSMARVAIPRVRRGDVGRGEEESLIQAGEKLDGRALWIDGESNLSVHTLRAKARRLASKHAIKLVLVDYLQLMSGSSPSSNTGERVNEVSEISRTLKQTARELGVPVIALAQLNRKAEDRTDGRPRLSDLRESGSLEQDADLVIMLHRDEIRNPDNPEHRGKMTMIVTKNRNGPTGECTAGFEREFVRVGNFDAAAHARLNPPAADPPRSYRD